MITDEERVQFLQARGYLPYGFDPSTRTAEETIEWALEKQHCPAYWHYPVNASEVHSTMPPRGNGMVFVRPGDRDRIDRAMRAEH